MRTKITNCDACNRLTTVGFVYQEWLCTSCKNTAQKIRRENTGLDQREYEILLREKVEFYHNVMDE